MRDNRKMRREMINRSVTENREMGSKNEDF